MYLVDRLPSNSYLLYHPATTEIYTLSLHDALPISSGASAKYGATMISATRAACMSGSRRRRARSSYKLPSSRSEEHTSELQTRPHLVCRLLLEKKKKTAQEPLTFKPLMADTVKHIA